MSSPFAMITQFCPVVDLSVKNVPLLLSQSDDMCNLNHFIGFLLMLDIVRCKIDTDVNS